MVPSISVPEMSSKVSDERFVKDCGSDPWRLNSVKKQFEE
jgi:hypothetical protein